MRLPNRLIIQAYVARGWLLWLLARGVVSALVSLAGGSPVVLNPGAALAMVVITVAIGLVQSRRLREQVLLNNLGVRVPVVIAMSAAPAIVSELLIGFIW